MTTVIHLTSRRAGNPVQTPAQSIKPKSEALTPERQAVIENCLNMSLHFLRQPGTTAADLWAATSRANRALTLLKQACYDVAGTSAKGRP